MVQQGNNKPHVDKEQIIQSWKEVFYVLIKCATLIKDTEVTIIRSEGSPRSCRISRLQHIPNHKRKTTDTYRYDMHFKYGTDI